MSADDLHGTLTLFGVLVFVWKGDWKPKREVIFLSFAENLSREVTHAAILPLLNPLSARLALIMLSRVNPVFLLSSLFSSLFFLT